MDQQVLDSILWLCHRLGSPKWRMAILGEGNASVRLDEQTFAVKGSGHSLQKLKPEGLAVCNFNPLVAVAEGSELVLDSDILLMDVRIDQKGVKPSTEAVFHAWLLTLPGVNYVAHAHPVAVNQVLCSEHGKRFAKRRLFPDHVVCCQSRSLWLPYLDPGLDLAHEICRRTLAFISEHGTAPNTFLLQNHGLITTGVSAEAVWGAMQMMEKAAQIFVGAASMSDDGIPQFMPADEVARIAGRPDEEYRRQILKFL